MDSRPQSLVFGPVLWPGPPQGACFGKPSVVWWPRGPLVFGFFTRRAVEGLTASDQWLKDTMDKILVTEQPEHWQKFCASNGWVAGFKRRYRISLLCQTNKKQTSIWEKLPKNQEISLLAAEKAAGKRTPALSEIRTISCLVYIPHGLLCACLSVVISFTDILYMHAPRISCH